MKRTKSDRRTSLRRCSNSFPTGTDHAHDDLPVFDRSSLGEMISRMIETKKIPNAAQGFAMTFGDEPFDGVDAELHWLRADEPNSIMGGNWYSAVIAGQEMQGWLCPALFCFFPTAPPRLFVRADQLPPGIDPIWHVAPDDPRRRRFMSPGDN